MPYTSVRPGLKRPNEFQGARGVSKHGPGALREPGAPVRRRKGLSNTVLHPAFITGHPHKKKHVDRDTALKWVQKNKTKLSKTHLAAIEGALSGHEGPHHVGPGWVDEEWLRDNESTQPNKADELQQVFDKLRKHPGRTIAEVRAGAPEERKYAEKPKPAPYSGPRPKRPLPPPPLPPRPPRQSHLVVAPSDYLGPGEYGNHAPMQVDAARPRGRKRTIPYAEPPSKRSRGNTPPPLFRRKVVPRKRRVLVPKSYTQAQVDALTDKYVRDAEERRRRDEEDPDAIDVDTGEALERQAKERFARARRGSQAHHEEAIRANYLSPQERLEAQIQRTRERARHGGATVEEVLSEDSGPEPRRLRTIAVEPTHTDLIRHYQQLSVPELQNQLTSGHVEKAVRSEVRELLRTKERQLVTVEGPRRLEALVNPPSDINPVDDPELPATNDHLNQPEDVDFVRDVFERGAEMLQFDRANPIERNIQNADDYYRDGVPALQQPRRPGVKRVSEGELLERAGKRLKTRRTFHHDEIGFHDSSVYNERNAAPELGLQHADNNGAFHRVDDEAELPHEDDDGVGLPARHGTKRKAQEQGEGHDRNRFKGTYTLLPHPPGKGRKRDREDDGEWMDRLFKK